MTVNSGATLGGTGTVTGRVASTTVNDGGTLAPGDNAVGDLVVAGNLMFQNLANYLVQVSPTNASNTFVTGSATLGGTLTANAVGGPYTLNQIFPVVSAVGSLTGTFSGIATTGDFGTATLSLAYGPHEAFLIITASGASAPVWRSAPGSSDWNTGTNWDSNTVPTPTDIALFNASTITTIDIQQPNTQVGGLQFNAGAPAYTFNVTGTGSGPSSLVIQGNGVADISGNAPTFVVSGVAGGLGTLQFNNASSAGDAVIITNAFGQTIFTGNSTGSLARFITNAGGVVDFSGTTGSAGNNRVAAGSIEGAGTYNLGANSLSVGLNGLSTTVSGSINDGGASGGAGASLVKVGDGTLILSGTNTYTGLTAVLGGMLQLGDGGTSGSILGNVFTHTTFAINRSDTYTFGGRIVGDGAFVQMGPGTTILTANNPISAAPRSAAGTLQLGDGGTSGGIAGDVAQQRHARLQPLRHPHPWRCHLREAARQPDRHRHDDPHGRQQLRRRHHDRCRHAATRRRRHERIDPRQRRQQRHASPSTAPTSSPWAASFRAAGAFNQIGTGTTILTAANTYSGGTAVNEGVLAAAADANLGAATGGLAFDGGTLQFLSGFATNRAVALNAGGGTFDTNGNSATLAGVISGIGGLTKIGAGTLVLSGANSYTGGTILSRARCSSPTTARSAPAC